MKNQHRLGLIRHKETIFFAVTGMSPAILTETVWALAMAKPAVVPDRVIAITTRQGAEQIKNELLSPRPEWKNLSVWSVLRDALRKRRLPVQNKLQFGLENIRTLSVLDPVNGLLAPVEDIRTPADNLAVADFILEELRKFTENPHIQVIASIAGGRKTMSAIMYGCMTLIGRETDRLTHILVNEPFESPALKPRFYFPDQPQGVVVAPTGKKFPTKIAKIELADLPFVPLRNRFKDLERANPAAGIGHFSALVRDYSKKLTETERDPVRVSLDFPARVVVVDGRRVKVSVRSVYLLDFLMCVGEAKIAEPESQENALEPLKKYLQDVDSESVREWAKTVVNEDLRKELSKLRKSFKMAGVGWGPGERGESLKLPPFRRAST